MSKKKAPPRQGETKRGPCCACFVFPRKKLNLVAQSIRGLAVEKALNELEFSRKRISKDVRKCLQSAIANAENNHNLDIDSLVVAQAHVGKNMVMKRSSHAPVGVACGSKSRISQITIVVRTADEGGGRLMGQKVNPIGLRLGVNRTWDSRWYANTGEYAKLLHEDIKITQGSQGTSQPGGHFAHRDRTAAQEMPRDDLHRQTGRGDWQKGR